MQQQEEKERMGTVQLKNMPEQSYTMRESLRTLKTNIQFCGDDIKTILFTSAIPDEGKSFTVVNLARSLADSKKRVLVLDADMRKSIMLSRLNATREGGRIFGLSHYLSGQKRMGDIIYTTQIPWMYIIFAGPLVPNPTELLEKKYFEDLLTFARAHFDYILIDCPPIGAAIDAAVIGTHCDGAVIVAAQGTVNARMLNDVKRQVSASGVKIIGAILNKVDMKKNGYYGKYYGSYYGKYYGKYYGEESDKKKKKTAAKSEKTETENAEQA